MCVDILVRYAVKRKKKKKNDRMNEWEKKTEIGRKRIKKRKRRWL